MKINTKRAMLSALVPADLIEALDGVAQRRMISRSGIIREALLSALDRDRAKLAAWATPVTGQPTEVRL